MLQRLFGKKKESEVPVITAAAPSSDQALPEAIQRHRLAIQTLEKRQQLLEKKIELETADAKRRVEANDKRGALVALKKRKMMESELDTLTNERITLEQQINSLESSQMHRVALTALAHGVAVQRSMNKQIDASAVDKLMDDIQEQQDLQQEIGNALSLGNKLADDEDLLAEFDKLQAEAVEDKLNEVLPSSTTFSSKGVEREPVQKVDYSMPSGPLVVPRLSQSSSEPAAADRTAVPVLDASEESELKALQQQLGH